MSIGEREFAVVPTADSQRDAPLGHVPQRTCSSLIFFGHHVEVDLATGNLTVSKTDVAHPYYQTPFGVQRVLDVQQQHMHDVGQRDFVNSDPRPHWFGNWRFGFEASIDPMWQQTQAELTIDIDSGLGGLFYKDGSDFDRSKAGQDGTLAAYGIPRRLLSDLGWPEIDADFLLRTKHGPFLVASGAVTPESLVDFASADVFVFAPLAGTGCRITSANNYDMRTGSLRTVDRSLVLSKWSDGLGHSVELKPIGAAPYARYSLVDGSGRRIVIERGHSLTTRDGQLAGGLLENRLVSSVLDDSLPSARQIDYNYGEVGHLTEVSFSNGQSCHYGYGSSLQGHRALTSIANTAGDRLRFDYERDLSDNDDRLRPRLKIKKITDPMGNYWEYDYDHSQSLTTVRVGSATGLDREVEYEYLRDEADTQKRFIIRERTVVGRGFVFVEPGLVGPRSPESAEVVERRFVYSEDGRFNLLKTIDPLSRVERYGYNDFNQITQSVDRNGRATTFTYDIPSAPSLSNPRRFDLLSESTIELLRDIPSDAGGVLSEHDVSVVREYRYGRYAKWSSSEVKDHGTQSTHRPISRTNEAGFVWTMDYHDKKHTLLEPTRIHRPDGTTTKRSFDNRGQLTTAIDAEGNHHRYKYTAHGQLLYYTEPDGKQTTLTYGDDHEGPIAITDQAGAKTNLQRNIEEQLISVRDPSGDVTQFHYDATGRLGRTSQGVSRDHHLPGVGPPGTVATRPFDTSFRYTPLGQLRSLRNTAGQILAFKYDEVGRRTDWTHDGDASTRTRFVYDSAGQLIGVVRRDGRTTTLSYHPGGEIHTIDYGHWEIEGTSVGGKLVTYTKHDYSGRPLDVQDSEYATANHYAYDKVGNLHFIRDDQGAEWANTYDPMGRLSVTYQYDELLALELERDALGRVESLTDSAAFDRWSRWRYRYHSDDDPKTTCLHLFERHVETTEWTTNFSYDAAGRVANVGVSLAGNAVLNQHAIYRPDGLTSHLIDDGDQRFSYDRLKQLVAVTCQDDASLDQIADYDPAGNRLFWAPAGAGPPERSEYESHNKLGWHSGDGARYSYDENGCVASILRAGMTTTYTTDSTGHIRRLHHPAGEIRYDYSYTGALLRRFGPDSSGQIQETRFGYLFGRLAQIETSAGDVTLFTWDETGDLLRVRSAAVTCGQEWTHTLFAVNDLSGNVVALVNVDGDDVARIEYDAWGTRTSEVDPHGILEFIGNSGGVREPLTGDTYLGSRWYSPEIGRWLSEDPIIHADSSLRFCVEASNLYRYARNSPLDYRDPSGLAPIPRSSGGQPDLFEMPARLQFFGGAQATLLGAKLGVGANLIVGKELKLEASGGVGVISGQAAIGVDRATKRTVTELGWGGPGIYGRGFGWVEGRTGATVTEDLEIIGAMVGHGVGIGASFKLTRDVRGSALASRGPTYLQGDIQVFMWRLTPRVNLDAIYASAIGGLGE